MKFLSSIAVLSIAAAHPCLAQDEPQNSAPVMRHADLDVEKVILVPTAPNITTTLVFPSEIQAIEGVGLTADPADIERALVRFAISHTEGTRFISITPLQSDASTNVNIICNDRVYVFLLTTSAESAVFKMTLSDPVAEAEEQARIYQASLRAKEMLKPAAEVRETLRVSPVRLIGLLDKVKAYHLLSSDERANVEDLKMSAQDYNPTETPQYSIQPLSVTRKGEWDALVFEVNISNPASSPLYYDPESFLAAVGPDSFRSVVSDASGEVPPKSTSKAYFVIQGDGAQGSNNLDPANDWLITIQQVEQGPPMVLPSKSNDSSK